MPRLSKIGAAALAAFGWTSGTSAVTVTYLVVAGGGGGGGYGGGGGAGGYLTGTLSLNPSLSYTVTVGAGGPGASVRTTRGTNGSDSVFSTVTSIGGGGGGSDNTSPYTGASGGSGGGGSYNSSGAGGSGTVGQGNAGGSGINSAPNYTSGGGGGAGAVGGNGSAGGAGGSGGNGLPSSISGTSTYYAGGGGGDSQVNGSVAPGGLGGGGAGARTGVAPIAGTANLGGGGGGGGSSSTNGAQGGSGVVIISYTAPQQFSGGVVTLSGGNVIHTFNTSGTLGPITPLTAQFLVVGGGGGGGGTGGTYGGGGGAGGFRSSTGLTIDPNSTYLVTVGAGGSAGSNGGDSAFSGVTSTGGGRGGEYSYAASTGGSGGGGGYYYYPTGAAGNTPSTSPSQGNSGGNGLASAGSPYTGGGGGGAGSAGSNYSGSVGGAGGAGSASSISGTATYYAGGGGGASGASTGGAGGTGGGGTGSGNGGAIAPIAGTAGTGGGGGGGGYTGASGGSGVVIISYPGSTQQMAGGTVTIVGGNVIHTFTSTGYLAPIKYATNSLRFRSSANPYLNRTPTVAGNRRTWTWSCWVKRGDLSGANNKYMFSATPSASVRDGIYFGTGQTMNVAANDGSGALLVTSQVFRDPAAWYHLVVAVDTTQAASTNRIKVYVNGVQVTSFSTSTYPSQNYDWAVNNTVRQVIGDDAANAPTGLYNFDGYMAEMNLIDGQALAPTSFGTFNSYGVWQPITYGGSYGTNGFYLPFTSNTSSYVGSFNGSNQYLSIASNSVFNQSGDFTIEYYANLTSNTNYQVAVGRGSGFITIQHSSDAGGMVRLVRYGTTVIASGGNVTAGKWNHFAIVRSGSTVTGYVNGIAVASGTDSTSTATGNALAIGQNSDGTNYFTGYISNVRYTNTAVYTSNFTPSTSALSAVSGTQLLTLQNASIVDNSTNALTITNNNTVTTGQTYPFAYGIFNDKSPQGNNWTPNNVSGVFGTTLDYMTDVPTLTSATVANFATLNPLDQASVTVSNANLQAYSGTTTANIRGTIAVSSGKWYWEVTAGTYDTLPTHMIGVCDATTAISATSWGTANCWSYYSSNGNKYNAGVNSAYGATYTTGDVIGIALDMDNGTLTFYKNGVSQGTAYTGLTGKTLTSSFGTAYYTLYCQYNFGQQPFKYTPPTGFIALNAYNL